MAKKCDCYKTMCKVFFHDFLNWAKEEDIVLSEIYNFKGTIEQDTLEATDLNKLLTRYFKEQK